MSVIKRIGIIWILSVIIIDASLVIIIVDPVIVSIGVVTGKQSFTLWTCIALTAKTSALSNCSCNGTTILAMNVGAGTRESYLTVNPSVASRARTRT
jgi:hypothetical protein